MDKDAKENTSRELEQWFERDDKKPETEKDKKTPETPASTKETKPNATKWKNYASDALSWFMLPLFYVLLVTLWCMFKHETAITIVELAFDISALVASLWAACTTCKSRASTEDQTQKDRLLNDVEEPPEEPKREYIFVDFNAWTYQSI